MNREDIKKHLISLSEEDYRKFSQSLLPDVENILGIRIPKLRTFSKDLIKDPEYYYFEVDNFYFEERMVKGFIVGYMNMEEDMRIKYIKDYLNFIDNWSICDSFVSSLKNIPKNRELYFPLVEECVLDHREFHSRFGIVCILNYYLTDQYISQVLDLFKRVETDHYYTEMALAWALSYIYMDFPQAYINFIRENHVSDFVSKKSLQKIRDSQRVTSEDKKELLSILNKK